MKSFRNMLLPLLILALSFGRLTAQAVLPEPKHEFYSDSTGQLYAPQAMPLFLNISFDTQGHQQLQLLQSSDGNGMYLSEGENKVCNAMSLQSANSRRKSEKCYIIIGDGTPPETKVRFVNAQHVADDTAQFYGPGLRAEISVNDNLSGVRETLFSLNNSVYKPFELLQNNFDNGIYSLFIFSTDKVGNRETLREFNFTSDISPPVTSLTINGNTSESIIASGTFFEINASDNLSGIEKITCRIDQNKELPYTKPVLIKGLNNAEHTFTWKSADRVGNREEEKTETFFFDDTPPEISLHVAGKQYNRENMLFVAAGTRIAIESTDNKAGVKHIKFQLNGTEESEYSDTIRLSDEKGLKQIRYFAVDKVENSTKPVTLKMYMDVTPPETYRKIDKPVFQIGDTLIFSTGTRLALVSTDMEAGVQNIYYRRGNDSLKIYTLPVEFNEEGFSAFEYRAIDNVQNSEAPKQLWIRVDNSLGASAEPMADLRHNKEWIKTGEHQLTGSSDHGFYLWISSSDSADAERFLLRVSNKDTEALQALSFTDNGKNNITLSLADKTAKIPIMTDALAPSTSIHFTGAVKTVRQHKTYYGPGLNISLSAIDKNNETSTGAEQTFFSVNRPDFAEYSDTLQFFDLEQEYTLRYYSIDKVKNTEDIKEEKFTVDITAPYTFPEFGKSVFGNYLSSHSVLKLIASDNLSGVKTTSYYFDNAAPKPYSGSIDSDFKNLSEGSHNFNYSSVDHVNNREQTHVIPIYIDHTPPEVTLEINGVQYKKGNTVFTAPGTSISLEAFEETTEIKLLQYRFSNSSYENYTTSVTVPSEHGSTYFTYLCTDRVDNSTRKSIHLYTDTEAPATKVQFKGPSFTDINSFYISKKTQIIISGSDKGSGIKNKFYALSRHKPLLYTKALELNGNGPRTLYYYAKDHVGNTEKMNSISFHLDNTPPKVEIQANMQEVDYKGENKITPYTFIHIMAQDNVENEKVMYAINDGEWQVYRKPLTYFEQGESFTLKIIAEDRVENKTEISAKFIVE